jgi:hypothetical protein
MPITMVAGEEPREVVDVAVRVVAPDAPASHDVLLAVVVQK